VVLGEIFKGDYSVISFLPQHHFLFHMGEYRFTAIQVAAGLPV
jgi:hypothetical protein